MGAVMGLHKVGAVGDVCLHENDTNVLTCFFIRFIELETSNVHSVSFCRWFLLQDGDTYLCPLCMLAYVGISSDETSFHVFLIYT